MKKQKSIALQFKKVSIAHINFLKGGEEDVNKQTANLETTATNNCPQNTQFPICLTTVSTRPDSFNTQNTGQDNATSL